MNKQFTTITLAITALIGMAQAASADDGQGLSERGMRFNFPANYYRQERANAPKDNNLPSGPRSGQVPQRGLLGNLDPDFLKPAPRPVAAPVMQPSVVAALTSTLPKIPNNSIPLAPTKASPLPPQFKAAFGDPLKVAQQPPAATARPAPAKSEAAKPVSKPPIHIAMGHNQGVHGVLHTPHLPQGLAATPAIASYNSGYSSGAFTPVPSTGSGSRSSTTLSGTIIPHTH